jgi:hypothetical protein
MWLTSIWLSIIHHARPHWAIPTALTARHELGRQRDTSYPFRHHHGAIDCAQSTLPAPHAALFLTHVGRAPLTVVRLPIRTVGRGARSSTDPASAATSHSSSHHHTMFPSTRLALLAALAASVSAYAHARTAPRRGAC